YDMKIVNNEVVVATHGRGIWTVELPELAGYEPPVVTLSPRISNFGGGMGGIISGLYRFLSAYDSSAIFVNDVRTVFFETNSNAFDTTIVISLPVDTESEAIVQVKAYQNGQEYMSPKYSVDLVPLLANKVTYLNDFETATDDFLDNGLSITTAPGFTGKAVHSDHPYKDNMDQYILLRVPIIVAETNAILEYDDIAMVEPGETGTVFGDEEFWDYVIVEGSNDNGYTWKPLISGYDASADFSWLRAYNNGTAVEPAMFKHHSINLHDTFLPYDEIVIRFRLFADANTNGWGWIIDNLEVQPLGTGIHDRETVPVSFNLYQNFPNPFNPSTTIKFDVPRTTDISITIFDALGRKVATINKKQVTPGSHKIVWNASHLASGVYFYHFKAGKYSQTKKLILMKR
ncbi:MAG TPA: T9SS type A sorting domain-containing protein, partial [Calditrichaeota bacterium]|nr:T9SS type A sorting domain-containing protein [Calditrichota bacterium]